MEYGELYADAFTRCFFDPDLADENEFRSHLMELKTIVYELTQPQLGCDAPTFSNIAKDIRGKSPTGGFYDCCTVNLSADELAFLIFYPFWSRMGGSFEYEFAKDGRLGRYLQLLKFADKCSEDPNGEVIKRCNSLPDSFIEFAVDVFNTAHGYAEAEYNDRAKQVYKSTLKHKAPLPDDAAIREHMIDSFAEYLSERIHFVVNLEHWMQRFCVSQGLCTYLAEWANRNKRSPSIIFDMIKTLSYVCGTEEQRAIAFLESHSVADFDEILHTQMDSILTITKQYQQ